MLLKLVFPILGHFRRKTNNITLWTVVTAVIVSVVTVVTVGIWTVVTVLIVTVVTVAEVVILKSFSKNNLTP